MSTDEQGVNGPDNCSQRTIYFKIYWYSLKSYFGRTYYSKTRPLKICWCNSTALWLSPMALRMWSQGTLCFYLGITMTQAVCVEQHRRIRFRHKDTGRTQPGIYEIEISFWCQKLSLPSHLKLHRSCWLQLPKCPHSFYFM